MVECLKLSEDQAHKYIEREAMELRQSRVEVARRIILTYRK
ncbi:MAG: ANTAR domain-containing protein [Clostridia bacterium]|nr:ANTAR domain-containing protein [Clostridia bacterium]